MNFHEEQAEEGRVLLKGLERMGFVYLLVGLEVHNLISHHVFIKWFYKINSPNKTVDLYFSVIEDIKLINLWGS